MQRGYLTLILYLFGLVMLEVGCSYSNPQCTQDGVKRFGTNCQFRCHCLNGEQCDAKTGACRSGCNYEWTGPNCQHKNIAIGKESRHIDNKTPANFSYLANDRNLTSCSFTGGPSTPREIAPWWAVWFPYNVTFKEFVFTTTDENLRYFSEFNVSVQRGVSQDDHRKKKVHEGILCYHENKTIPDNSTVHLKCKTELVGNQLRLQLANISTQLVICDFRISGECGDGYYGERCSQICGSNCEKKSKERLCHPVNGNCLHGCIAGWQGRDCKAICDPGFFGMNCSQNCGTNCMNSSGENICHHVNGICLHGCNEGWQGDVCESECGNGYYGMNCSLNCGTNCMNTTEEKICHHVNGFCLQGCNAGWKSDHCDVVCDPGFFGMNCSQNCGTNCMNSSGENICHHVNGICLHGCNEGWQGDVCDSECGNGYYGMNCSLNCGTNCMNTSKEKICHHVNGFCLHGCNAGWQGDHCDAVCDPGFFGMNCSQNCGTNCMNSSGENICHHVNGICLHGCNEGWQGDFCESECGNGFYGMNCSLSCGTNCMNTSKEKICHHVTGFCLHGCNAGWQGDHCSAVCGHGFFGMNCTQNCGTNCMNRSGENICHHVNGTCLHGCNEGWQGDVCESECGNGYYGMNCSLNCGTNCMNTSKEKICHHVNGFCLHECNAGWQGDHCNAEEPLITSKSECEDGYYGVNCSHTCEENCQKSSKEKICHHVNGTCLRGCNAGWQGAYCEYHCEAGYYGVNCSQICGKNCQNISKENVCHHVNGTCLHGCNAGWQGDHCEAMLNQLHWSFPVVAVVGGTSASVVFGIIIIAAFLLPRRKRRQGVQKEKLIPDNKNMLARGKTSGTLEPIKSKDKRSNQENLYINTRASDLLEQQIREGSGSSGIHASSKDDIEMIYVNDNQSGDKNKGHAVPVSELEAYVKFGFDHQEYFLDQFQKIPYGMQYPSVVATKLENIGKNKYKAMYAYDHSRVILKVEPCEKGTDYVNASFIKGYSCRNSYIAAQGPIEGSMSDFWRMIWEQNIRTIVMATNVIEEGKAKCKQYWPSVGETTQNGKLMVFLESEDYFTEFTIRRLKIYHEDQPGRQRAVTQFHFTAWPDKGVPRGTSGLLHFWYQVRKHNSDKKPPWLVHCSAGVGRTGTFLAIDILYDQGVNKGSIDVFQCVTDLRQQRVNMVQTKEQYKFLHSVMVEALVKPWKPVHIDQFSSLYDDLRNVDRMTGKTKLLLQYETLNDGLVVENGKDKIEDTVIAAKSAENKLKNRYDNIFAPNEFRPFLYTPVSECTDYINAVYIPGYRLKHDFIITQTPLTITAVDWCRLIIEEEVKFVVAFEDHDKTEVAEYLPETGTKNIGPFTVRYDYEEDRSYLTQRNYEIKYQSKVHRVSLLIYKCWQKSKLTPSDPNEMLLFLQELEQLKKQTNGAPIIVQCLNGAERSGLVVVLLNIIERVWYDNEVSIFQVIRQMKIIRQQIIPNFEQFKFCHDVLLSHTQYSSTYANM